jgi:hypothetical protein
MERMVDRVLMVEMVNLVKKVKEESQVNLV